MRELKAQRAPDATFGHAAKAVAIYLKTIVVCGGHDQTPLARIAHPPIDRILLRTLARDRKFPFPLKAQALEKARKLWRHTNWTEMDRVIYDEVIESLREAGLDEGGFWRVERWWVGDTG